MAGLKTNPCYRRKWDSSNPYEIWDAGDTLIRVMKKSMSPDKEDRFPNSKWEVVIENKATGICTNETVRASVVKNNAVLIVNNWDKTWVNPNATQPTPIPSAEASLPAPTVSIANLITNFTVTLPANGALDDDEDLF